MNFAPDLTTVTHGIQLAVAPVFLLTAVSGMIAAVAGRLARIIDRARFVENRLEAGGVYINGASPVVGCELPFGGVGISGFGREGGLEGLLEFTRTKAVAIS